jgi:hypothetical protein
MHDALNLSEDGSPCALAQKQPDAKKKKYNSAHVAKPSHV